MKKISKSRFSQQMVSMPLVNPHAAGIDIGSKSHFVSVAQDNVSEFGVCTDDLHQLAHHLQAHGVKTVALESTGFYWKPLFILLQDYGFEVILVNARHIKNVKGHKTDVVDCKWLQLLHSIGLLSNSFQPDLFTGKLRAYTRHRKYLIESASRYIAKMNKVLVLMNIQLSVVLRDITGLSGRRVIEAILTGERDAKTLAGLVSTRVKSSRQAIEKALVGDWREEYVFELQQSYELYELYWEKIRQTDVEIEKLLIQKPAAPSVDWEKYQPISRKGYQKNDPKIDLGRHAYEMSGGVDLLHIDGVGYGTLLTLMSETGFDLSMFPSDKHFASWLGFAPNRKITGGKVLSSRTRNKTNPLAKAIRDAANAAGNSHSRLGDFFRRIAYRKGRPVAITATARKIAVILYQMLTKKEAFNYAFSQQEQSKQRNRQLKNIIKKIKNTGITLGELELAFV